MPYASAADRQAYQERWRKSPQGRAARAAQKRRWRERKREDRPAFNPQPLARALGKWSEK